MNRLILVGAITLLASVTLPCATGAQTNDATRELRAFEDELSRALVERDSATLDRLWHPDLIFIGLNGQQSTKATRLAGQRTASPRSTGETNVNDEVEIRIEHGNTAVVTVVSTWTTPGEASVSVSRYRTLHVWTRDAGRWRLLASQVARILN